MQVTNQTVKDRADGQHKSHQKAAAHLQLVLPSQEEVMLKWCEHSSILAQPFGPCAHAFALTGKHPGKNWHYKYSKRHPALTLSKLSGLDPTCMKNFNETVVGDYFVKRQELEQKFEGIPSENQ